MAGQGSYMLLYMNAGQGGSFVLLHQATASAGLRRLLWSIENTKMEGAIQCEERHGGACRPKGFQVGAVHAGGRMRAGWGQEWA